MNLSKIILNLLVFSSANISKVASQCQEVTPIPNSEFDFDSYTNGIWYCHQQRPSPFAPLDQFNCVTAQYTLLNAQNGAIQAAGLANGYAIKVLNTSEDDSGNVFNSDDFSFEQNGVVYAGTLCGGRNDLDSQVTVGACVVPAFTFGGPNYWIIAYDEEEGYALIGAQTNVPTQDGLCTFASPTLGLWIFSRSPMRNEAMIEKYRGIAEANGIDPSIMSDVSHQGCAHTPVEPKSPKGPKATKNATKNTKKVPKRS